MTSITDGERGRWFGDILRHILLTGTACEMALL
jgi:hypothetical protein